MRLAERRGVLVGAHLSEVQEWAVSMLSLLDRRERAVRYADDLRARMVAAHPESAKYVFPEWFEGSIFQEAARADGTYDIDKIDDSQVSWGVPTPDEAAELDRWIAENSRGSITATELDQEGGGWT